MKISRIILTTATAFSIAGLGGAAFAQTYQGQAETDSERTERMNREASSSSMPDAAGNSTYRDADGNLVYRDSSGNITYRDASGNVTMTPPNAQTGDNAQRTTQQMRNQRLARADRN